MGNTVEIHSPIHCFQIGLVFSNIGFVEGGQTRKSRLRKHSFPTIQVHSNLVNMDTKWTAETIHVNWVT